MLDFLDDTEAESPPPAVTTPSAPAEEPAPPAPAEPAATNVPDGAVDDLFGHYTDGAGAPGDGIELLAPHKPARDDFELRVTACRPRDVLRLWPELDDDDRQKLIGYVKQHFGDNFGGLVASAVGSAPPPPDTFLSDELNIVLLTGAGFMQLFDEGPGGYIVFSRPDGKERWYKHPLDDSQRRARVEQAKQKLAELRAAVARDQAWSNNLGQLFGLLEQSKEANDEESQRQIQAEIDKQWATRPNFSGELARFENDRGLIDDDGQRAEYDQLLEFYRNLVEFSPR
jgi:hypothetical protein